MSLAIANHPWWSLSYYYRSYVVAQLWHQVITAETLPDRYPHVEAVHLLRKRDPSGWRALSQAQQRVTILALYELERWARTEGQSRAIVEARLLLEASREAHRCPTCNGAGWGW